jgi:hypothetical protein
MWRRTKSLRKKSNWEVIHRSLRFNNQAAFGSGAEMLLELIEKNMHFSYPANASHHVYIVYVVRSSSVQMPMLHHLLQ